MDSFALELLEWLGRLIAQRLAGGVIHMAWKRVAPKLKTVLKLSEAERERAGAQQAETDEVRQDLVEMAKMLEEAAVRIAALEEENAGLRARLAERGGG